MGTSVREVLALLLAGVFLVAGLAKLGDLGGARRGARELGFPSTLAWPTAIGLPAFELALAAGLVVESTTGMAAAAAAGLLATFAVVIAVNVLRGRSADCGCFGRLHSSRAGVPSMARNGVLALVALWIALTPAGPVGPAELCLALVVGIVVAQAILWYALLRRYGRALRRLEKLESSVPETGLEVASEAPQFVLPDLRGARVALRDLLAAGRPVLVSFVDPHCGPCHVLLPKLGRWQRELADRLTIAIVGRGDPGTLRSLVDHGHVEILVSEDGAVADAYAVEATPSAVLIAPDGSIASGLHYGAEGIEAVIVSLASVPHGNEASPRETRDPSHALEVALVR